LWSGEGLFIGIFEAQNLGGGKILPPPDLKPGGAIAPAAPRLLRLWYNNKQKATNIESHLKE